jgi:hypothetical protein
MISVRHQADAELAYLRHGKTVLVRNRLDGANCLEIGVGPVCRSGELS